MPAEETEPTAAPTTMPPESLEAPEPEAEDTLRRILRALVPETGDRVVFEDLCGTVYERPAKASIRVEQKLVQLVQDRIPNLSNFTDIRSPAAMLGALARPEVASGLAEAMRLLHPGPCKQAVERIREEHDDDTLDLLDAFSSEQILAAVLPFFAGPLIRLLDLIQPQRARAASRHAS
jgi:hypothetical protein